MCIRDSPNPRSTSFSPEASPRAGAGVSPSDRGAATVRVPPRRHIGGGSRRPGRAPKQPILDQIPHRERERSQQRCGNVPGQGSGVVRGAAAIVGAGPVSGAATAAAAASPSPCRRPVRRRAPATRWTTTPRRPSGNLSWRDCRGGRRGPRQRRRGGGNALAPAEGRRARRVGRRIAPRNDAPRVSQGRCRLMSGGGAVQ